MRRASVAVLSAVIVLAVPAVLLGNGLWLLLNPWYVHAEYARPGFPDDRFGFSKEERTDLALIGLRSIQPQHREGVEVLREARLPDGTAAFTEREVVHMQDVRRLVGLVLLAHALALAAALVAAAVLRYALGVRGEIARALFRGGLLTLAAAGVLGVLMLVSFDWFFVQFHEALFTGDTWLFADEDTLIRLYPDAFWSDFGGVLAGLTILQAVLLSGGIWWVRRRRTRVRAPAGEGQTLVTEA